MAGRVISGLVSSQARIYVRLCESLSSREREVPGEVTAYGVSLYCHHHDPLCVTAPDSGNRRIHSGPGHNNADHNRGAVSPQPTRSVVTRGTGSTPGVSWGRY